MTLEVVKLKTWESEVKEDIIKTLEDTLEKAKKGEFEGLAIVAGYPDGSCFTVYCKSVNQHTIISGIAILQHRIISGRSDNK